MVDHPALLPPETWLVIMDLLADTTPDPNWNTATDNIILQSSPHIRTVSTLSRFFHQLTDPYRFRNANLMVDTLGSPMLRLRRIEELLNLLEHRPEIKTWIRTLSIGQSCILGLFANIEFDKKYPTIEQRVQKLVPELHSLNSLRCGLISFSSPLFSGVLRLPQLGRLELEHFQLPQSASENTVDWSTVDRNKTSLRSLTIMTLGPPAIQTVSAIIHLLQRETLVELIYQPSMWRSQPGGVTLLEVISTHIPDYVFVGLRRLAIKLSSADVEVRRFVDLGARCPNLTTLSIDSMSLFDSSSQIEDRIKRGGIALHHFPALQRFEGPLVLAPIFTQGRSVHTVIGDALPRSHGIDWAENETTPAPSIATLRPGVPLRVLHLVVLQWSDADIEAVAQYHPELQELVYSYLGEGKMFWSARSEEAFRKLSNLRRIALGESLNSIAPNVIEDDHHTITKLRNLCPSLQQADISELGTWRLRPERKH
ncbi:hypothetical protein FRC05_007503 [Tulasnella sp. 425]|nr:hypothetical protein FRC05_007503 [Tulasnella sp. 425]